MPYSKHGWCLGVPAQVSFSITVLQADAMEEFVEQQLGSCHEEASVLGVICKHHCSMAILVHDLGYIIVGSCMQKMPLCCLVAPACCDTRHVATQQPDDVHLFRCAALAELGL